MEHEKRVLDQIRTLLAIADGGSPYPEERALARERAERLMVRYAIDEAGARFAPGEAEQPTTRQFDFAGMYVKDQVMLACAVTRVFSCRSVIYGGRRVTSVGFASDLAIASALIDSLIPAMRTEMDAYGGSQSRKKSFAAAYTDEVARRLKGFYAGAVREAEEDGTGSALVLADRGARIDSAYESMFPNLRAARPRRLQSWEGWTAGGAAGRRADISLGRKVDHGAVHALER